MSKEERFEYIQDTYHLFMAWIFDYKTDKEYNIYNKNDIEDIIKLLNEQDQKISDLEAKLAEVKKLLDKYCYKNINELEDVFNCNFNKVAQLSQITVDLKNDVSRRNGEILKLKQQLAEKEKERELDNSFWKQECDSLQKALAESEKKILELQADSIRDNQIFNEYLAKKEKKIDKLEDKLHHYYEETLNNGTCGLCEHLRGEYKTDFAIEQLEKVEEFIDKRNNGTRNGNHSEQYKDGYSGCCCDIADQIDQQIKELKEGK